MITDQPTQTTPQLPPRAQGAAALARLAARHPRIANRDELAFYVEVDGTVDIHVDVNHPQSLPALRELATALGLSITIFRYVHREQPRVSLTAFGDFDGVQWSCKAYVRADAYDFDAFTQAHSADPQEWTEKERAQYAALAGSAAAA